MTRQQFVDKHGEALKIFLNSECGIASLTFLNGMKPIYEFSKEPHLFAENRGATRGYELCLRNLISLSLLPKSNEEIEADYGVPDNNQQSE